MKSPAYLAACGVILLTQFVTGCDIISSKDATPEENQPDTTAPWTWPMGERQLDVPEWETRAGGQTVELRMARGSGLAFVALKVRSYPIGVGCFPEQDVEPLDSDLQALHPGTGAVVQKLPSREYAWRSEVFDVADDGKQVFRLDPYDGSGREVARWLVGESSPRWLTYMPNGPGDLRLSPDDQVIAAGCSADTVRLLRAEDGAILWEKGYSTSLGRSIDEVAFSPDGSLILALARRHGVYAIRTEDGGCVWFRPDDDFATTHISSIECLPGTGQFIAATGRSVDIRNVSDGALVRRISAEDHPFYDIALAPDGRRAVFGGAAGDITIWDLDTGTRLRTIAAHRSHIVELVHVAVTPDGEHILSGGGDGVIRMWRLDDQAEQASIVKAAR